MPDDSDASPKKGISLRGRLRRLKPTEGATLAPIIEEKRGKKEAD
jgi:hypothetical protein